MTLKARRIRLQMNAAIATNQSIDPFIPQRSSRDICVVHGGDNGQCLPTKCKETDRQWFDDKNEIESTYFYHRTIIREQGANRSIAQIPSKCIVSDKYKFVYLDALNHRRADSIHNALTGCLCPDGKCSTNFMHHQKQCDPEILENEEYFVFTFVRDPYARLVADWFSTKENKGKLWIDMIQNGQLKRNQIPISLKDFISNPQSIKRFAADPNQVTSLHKQTRFVMDERMCPTVNFVGKLEDAAQEDWGLILKHIQQRYQSFPEKRCMAKLHFDALHPEEESWIKLLMNDTETQDVIHEKFEEDFEYFGYSRYV